MSNFISLEQAVAMTTRYRKEMEAVLAPEFRGKNILPICETFDRSSFDALLKETDAHFIRVYLGMDDTDKIRVIAVAADAKGIDILPVAGKALDGGGNIVEDGIRCPTNCPPASALNPS